MPRKPFMPIARKDQLKKESKKLFVSCMIVACNFIPVNYYQVSLAAKELKLRISAFKPKIPNVRPFAKTSGAKRNTV